MLGLPGRGRKTIGCWRDGNDDTFDEDQSLDYGTKIKMIKVGICETVASVEHQDRLASLPPRLYLRLSGES